MEILLGFPSASPLNSTERIIFHFTKNSLDIPRRLFYDDMHKKEGELVC